MQRLTPLFARVLMKREALKSGSIIITQAAGMRNAPTRGEVIARGPTADPSIIVGKSYVFGQHAGTWLRADGKVVQNVDQESGEVFFVCQDEDLICEVTEEHA